mgnify:FL=1
MIPTFKINIAFKKIEMSKTVRSTSSIYEFFKWKVVRFMLERKQSRLLKFYENGKYENISKVIKTQKDYE